MCGDGARGAKVLEGAAGGKAAESANLSLPPLGGRAGERGLALKARQEKSPAKPDSSDWRAIEIARSAAALAPSLRVKAAP